MKKPIKKTSKKKHGKSNLLGFPKSTSTIWHYHTRINKFRLMKMRYGNYEHALTHIVFKTDELSYKAWGVQHDAIVVPLTYENRKFCEKMGWNCD